MGRDAREAIQQFPQSRSRPVSRIVVKTQRTDLHGRYVTHYSPDDLDIPTCFTQGTHLNEELLKEGHAVLAV